MITIKDRGAVAFLEEGETPFDEISSSDCNCVGREFCQIVHSGDTTPFQVEVSEDTGTNIVTNGTFATDTSWTKGTGWTIAGGVGVHTSSGGGALSQSIAAIKASTYYKIVFTINTYSNSQTLSVVFAGDTVKTLNATGTYTVYWFTDAILGGTTLSFTPHATTNLTIDNVSVTQMTTISYGIKDLNDDVVKIVYDGTGITYYQTMASIEVDWSTIEDGCYRLFLIENGTNLFTQGDNGTFETTSDPGGEPPSDWGITQGNCTIRYGSAHFYTGTKSMECEIGQVTAGTKLLWNTTASIAVEANSVYVIDGYFKDPIDDSRFQNIEMYFKAQDIVSISTVSYMCQTNVGNWNYIRTVFNSESNTNIKVQFLGIFPVSTVGFSLNQYIDQVSVRGPINIESECFKKGTFGCTQVLSWSNTENAYGFIYEGTSFEHQIRLDSKLWKPKYPKDKKEVFVDSAGNRRILTSRTKKEEILNIGEIPEYLHDAISIGLEHDNFYIDGVKYINEETDYDPNWRNSSMLGPVQVTVTKDSQDLSNSYC